MNEKLKPNRLIYEKSPYLLQHAYNPVDWYPWGEEAFAKAKMEDKPIFLSIGYSTCYWCHVMEREVFENKEIASEMNRIFVNIKLDREERPDIDRIYMASLQAMTGSGGWPMSMFLNHDLKPFYAATYIPPYPSSGMPGFINVIKGIEEAWKLRRIEINNAGDRIIKYIEEISRNKQQGELNDETLTNALNHFKNSFDEEYGGFGSAPKFPRSPGINFLLRMAYRYNDSESADMVVRTLKQIIKGGIYDHLGGGFHRYSVDRLWHVPHFEKMLYDQAQLCINYTEAFQLSGRKEFENVVKETLEYVDKVLRSPEGGYFSAEDAESAPDISKPDAKSEGAYYVWTKKEIDKVLGDDSEIFCYHYGVEPNGNIRSSSDPHGVLRGKNVLYVPGSLETTSEKFSISPEQTGVILSKCKKQLLLIRETRLKPHLDDKILTNWNSLMISAFIKAYQVFGVKDYLLKAMSATDFILAKLYKNDRIYHRYRLGDVAIEGLLEDYALLISALLDLYDACFDEKYLTSALNLADLMIHNFYDDQNHGFFDTMQSKDIIVRTKEDYDSAEPAGNSIAIYDLLRLSYLIGDKNLSEIAEKSLKSFSLNMKKIPYAMPQMLISLDYFLHKPVQIIISGNDATADEMKELVFRKFIPGRILIKSPKADSITFASKIISDFNLTRAYICENFSCSLPVDTVDEFKRSIVEK